MDRQLILGKLSDPGFVKNILIVRQHNQLGDMLCSVPLYESLRRKFPHAKITLVASPVNYRILYSEINPFIDEILVFDKSTITGILNFLRKLRSDKYQLGIVPSTVAFSRTSHIINFLSGAPIRVGAAKINNKVNKAGYLLNVSSEFNWDVERKHQIERNLDIGRQLGCDLPENERTIKLKLSDEEINFANDFFKQNFKTNRVIGLHPGAGKIQNQWAIENFLALIKKFCAADYNEFMISSGNIDVEVTQKLSELLSEANIGHVILRGQQIRNVAACIKKLALYITNDTGVMHVAAGVDANVVSLFGPTNGFEWAPWGKNKIFIQSKTKSVNDISVEEVFKNCIELLNDIGRI